MTLTQIQYAIACANAKSFTKAAESVFTTTSNLSKTIRMLEQELGYNVFQRDHSGVSLTPEGVDFIVHANNIMNEIFSINQIEKKQSAKKLTITFMYNPYVFFAIEHIVQESQKKRDSMAFSFLTSSHIFCLDALVNGQSDFSITAIPTHAISQYHELLKVKGLQYEEICKLDTVITVREGHPLAIEYQQNGEVTPSHLHDYTYVMPSTFDISDFPITIPRRAIETYINPDTVIRVNPHSWRDDLLKNTDSYAIGYQGPAKYLSSHGLCSLPVSKKDLSLYALSTPKSCATVYCNKIIEFLRDIATEE